MRASQAVAVAVPADEKRGVARRVINLSAFAREADLRLLDIRVMDLCEEGCRIAGEIDLEQATRIWLKIPGMNPRPARVAWSKPGEAGCAFEEPIVAELLEEVVLFGRRSTSDLRKIFRAPGAETA